MRSPRAKAGTKPEPRRRAMYVPWCDVFDVLAMATWSLMLFRYWFGGKLALLLHPDYAWLSNSAAIILALLAAFKLFKAIEKMQGLSIKQADPNQGHITLLPPSFSSTVLLAVAVFGLIYTPRAFASQTAIQRGISETLTLTRTQPQRFARAAAPEERTVIDWIRLINVYPEPDAYASEAVDVKGFTIHPEGWPNDYVMVSRFVLTCCAADAYPVGLPVKLAEGRTKADYPVDNWIQVRGAMTTETLDNRRQLAIASAEISEIEEPKNPYEY